MPSPLRHNADALMLGMAKGLADCTADSSGPPIATLLRAAVQNSKRPDTDAGNMLDAEAAAALIDPMLARLTDAQRQKLSVDLLMSAALFFTFADVAAKYVAPGARA